MAASLALAVNLGIGYALAGPVGPHGYAIGQSAAFLTVLVVTGVVALRSLPTPPLKDCALVLLAVAVMAAAVWPLRERFAPLPELVLQAGLGAIIYGGVVLASDALRLRTMLRLWWLARRSRRRAA